MSFHEACRAQYRGIGRQMKVGKEGIILVDPRPLAKGEEKIVAARLRDIFAHQGSRQVN